MLQGKEVPGSVAAEFLQDVDKDPKFVRFHQRLAAVGALNEVRTERADYELATRNERTALRHPDPRLAAWVLLLATPLVGVAVLLAWVGAGKWALLEIAAIALALLADELRARRAQFRREVRLTQLDEEERAKLTELDEQEAQLRDLIAESDRQMESSVKIIDPETFGKPRLEAKKNNKDEEKRSS